MNISIHVTYYVRIMQLHVSIPNRLISLINNHADIAFTDDIHINKRKEALQNSNIISIFLIKNELLITAPLNDEFINRTEIGIEELEKHKFIGVNDNDPKAFAFNEFVGLFCEQERININYSQKFDNDQFSENIYKSSMLSFADTLHASYYLRSQEHRKMLRIKNRNIVQNIYLCYRETSSDVSLLVDFIKNHFYSIFYYKERQN